jgi:hypothetical protein
MAKQTFTTGQVLTAAQMTSLQDTAMGGGPATAKTASYVLVAADAGTTVAMNAAGATTITVNTGLFAAGDTVFIQNLGAGACTVTAGTATVATAGSLILPQNDAGILYFTSASAAIFYDYIQAGAVSPLTTKGDLYTFSTSDARLAVGANGTTLVADSAEATGLKWATASSGGMTLLTTHTLSGSTSTISGISGSYKSLFGVITGVTTNGSGTNLKIDPNGSTLITNTVTLEGVATTPTSYHYVATWYMCISANLPADSDNCWAFTIDNYASTTKHKPVKMSGQFVNAASNLSAMNNGGGIRTNSAITSLDFVTLSGSFTAGTVLLYGVS